MTFSVCKRRRAFSQALAMLVAAFPSQVRSQAPEYQGLAAGLAGGHVMWHLDDGEQRSHFMGGLFVGYRFHLADIDGAALSVTPRFAIAVTQFKGIRLNSNQVALSRVDFPSGQVAIRIGGVRPYVLIDKGTVTIERYVGSSLVNYSGGATAYGFGIELPRNNPCGAGFDIAVRRTTARLTDYEWRGLGAPPPGGSLGATIMTVGWSGRFRGSRLLFACH